MQFHRLVATLISGVGALCFNSVTTVASEMGRGASIGDCYMRADVGYGWSRSSDATSTISPYGYWDITGKVQDADLDGSWLGEVGFGCGLVRQSMTGGSLKDEPIVVTSPSGLRGDVTFGFHGDRDFDGEPFTPPKIIDPVHATIKTNTLMFNIYYDFMAMGRITPYVGAGIGMAFVDLRDVTFTNGYVVRLPDQSETNFAWSLMAGVATDIGRNIKLDLGYRFIDMGDIETSNASGSYRLNVSELGEHQVKVGIRIPFSALGR